MFHLQRTFLASRLYSKTNLVRSSISSVSENMARSPLEDVHVALLGSARDRRFPRLAGTDMVLEAAGWGWPMADSGLADDGFIDGRRKLVGLVLAVRLGVVSSSGSPEGAEDRRECPWTEPLPVDTLPDCMLMGK